MTKNIYDTELKTCDRCGFDHKKSSLRKQKGLWLSGDCFDVTDRIPNLRLRWQSPRDDSNTLTVPPAATPEVFTFTSVGGINLLAQTHELAERRDGRHKSIFMKIKSDGGNISISADPQVTPGTLLGDLLTSRIANGLDATVANSATGTNAFNIDFPANFKSGWFEMAFDTAGTATMTSTDGVVVGGLPAVGFVVEGLVVGSELFEGNFTFALPHNSKVSVTPVPAP